MTAALPPAIMIMGPTASGKTALALALAEVLPVELISVDSALVYRGMDIGSAKPSAEELAKAPHRLIDIRDPAEPYSAADFREDALREMADITAAGHIPLLVGGTMLYFRALLQGMAQMPSSDAQVRERLEDEMKTQGLAALHERLAKVDSTAAARIHPNDPQRTLRALEVWEVSGQPLTQWHEQEERQAFPYRVAKMAVCPKERSILHERIAIRFRKMLDEGFLEEVEGLRKRGDLSLELPSMKAVGYRQVWEYLDGRWDRETMIHKGIVATRQLAKRQMTWLRKEADLLWLDGEEADVSQRAIEYANGILT